MDDENPSTFVERRADAHQLAERVAALEVQCHEMAVKVDAMYSIISAATGFFKVLSWLGSIAKPLLYLGVTLAAIGAVFKGKTGV